MSALVYRLPQTDQVYYRCPACKGLHMFVDGEGDGPRWIWNHNFTSPTVAQEVQHVTSVRRSARLVGHTCRYYITNGRMQFAAQCTHTLAGQIVSMLPFTDEDIAALLASEAAEETAQPDETEEQILAARVQRPREGMA